MKILCVIDSLGSGGAQRQLVELAAGFKTREHDVSFLVYHNLNFFKSNLDAAKIPVDAIIEPNSIKRILKMRKHIRNGDYDAVLSFLEAANCICEVSAFPYRRWKLVVGERSANPGILKSPKLILLRWFHFFASYVVANSHANIKIVFTVKPLLPKSKCKVIYNIVNFSIWKQSHYYIPLKDGKLKLVVVSSHQFLKNLNGLIEALSILPEDEQKKLSIDWYGESLVEPFVDNSFPDAKQKIILQKLDNIITFYPPTREITQKIQEADAVGLFSFYEGLPNSICEGMACAKPVICSKISDVPELIPYDSNLLFDPSDPRSIEKSLKYLINLSKDQLIQIGEKNAKICKKNFAKENIITEYLKLLSK
jgi:glycosyltransferase involved in cell wall biosynthesis